MKARREKYKQKLILAWYQSGNQQGNRELQFYCVLLAHERDVLMTATWYRRTPPLECTLADVF